MLKRDIEFTDYNDEVQKKTFFFNLNRSEVIKIELAAKGGLESKIEKMVSEKDAEGIMKTIDELIMLSYGEKSHDGSFVKSPEISKAFSQTMAYDTLFMELVTDPDATAAFIEGIIPKPVQAPPQTK